MQPFKINSVGIPVLTDTWGSNQGWPAAIAQLKATGATHIEIQPDVWEDNRASSTMSETDNATVATLVSLFKAQGFDVAIRPSILMRTPGKWTGVMQPTDVDAWFTNYKSILMTWARYAESAGVSTLHIGNELPDLLTSGYRDKWLDIISSIRAVYHGQVAINATGPHNSALEVPNISFADQLDYVGLSFYVDKYTNHADPTVNELVSSWTSNANGVNLSSVIQATHDRYGKPVAITEIAFHAAQGSNTDAWNGSPTGSYDPQEQANQYEAFMRFWSSYAREKPWFLGTNIWGWFPANTTTMFDKTTPQGKAAYEVLKDWYSGRAAYFDGASSAYVIANDSGAALVSSGGTSWRLPGVEAIEFRDRTVFTAKGDDATIARLYQAALGRTPDVAGLLFQQDAHVAGLTLQQLSHNFQTSAEFTAKYGSTTNSQFATLLYNNVLGRTPDLAGLKVQVDALDGGLSRDQLLLNFADSAENKSHVASWLWDLS